MVQCSIILAVVTCVNTTPADQRPTPQAAVAILTASSPPFVLPAQIPNGPTSITIGVGPRLGPWDGEAIRLPRRFSDRTDVLHDWRDGYPFNRQWFGVSKWSNSRPHVVTPVLPAAPPVHSAPYAPAASAGRVRTGR